MLIAAEQQEQPTIDKTLRFVDCSDRYVSHMLFDLRHASRPFKYLALPVLSYMLAAVIDPSAGCLSP